MTRAVAPIEVGLGLIPVLVAPWAVARIVRVFQDDGGALNRSLGATARLLLVYSILYAVSLVATASPQ
jgi:hypothetical protein